MVEEITNLSDLQIGLTDILPTELVGQIDKLVFISKIAVYIVIGYIIFLLIKNFYGWRRGRRINKMYHKIDDIDRKLDMLIKVNKKIEVVEEKKESWSDKLFKKKDKKKKLKKKK
jgi:hypothetical protein